MSLQQRICCVSYDDGKASVTTMANSVLEAVRNAMEHFKNPLWKGGPPPADTEFRVSLVGDGGVWMVTAGRIRQIAPHSENGGRR